MNSQILGMNVSAIVVILLLVILGIVSFHYYTFIVTGKQSAVSAGIGAGASIFPYQQ